MGIHTPSTHSTMPATWRATMTGSPALGVALGLERTSSSISSSLNVASDTSNGRDPPIGA